MYKIVVIKNIWTQEKNVVDEHMELIMGGVPKEYFEHPEPQVAILRKELEIPFTPFIGLEIATDDWFCRPIQRISWRADEGRFFCDVEDNYPGMYVDSYISYKDLVEIDLGLGWERPEKDGGDAPR